MLGVPCCACSEKMKNKKLLYLQYIYIFFERPDDFLFAFVDVFLQLLTKIYVLPLGRCSSGFVVFVLFI